MGVTALTLTLPQMWDRHHDPHRTQQRSHRQRRHLRRPRPRQPIRRHRRCLLRHRRRKPIHPSRPTHRQNGPGSRLQHGLHHHPGNQLTHPDRTHSLVKPPTEIHDGAPKPRLLAPSLPPQASPSRSTGTGDQTDRPARLISQQNSARTRRIVRQVAMHHDARCITPTPAYVPPTPGRPVAHRRLS